MAEQEKVRSYTRAFESKVIPLFELDIPMPAGTAIPAPNPPAKAARARKRFGVFIPMNAMKGNRAPRKLRSK